jgi:aryl-alcohol dehydrogenase-like predicted oxidoreductase
MIPKRTLGKTGIETSTLIVGGHSFSDLPGKVIPDIEDSVRILTFLYEQGMTHFDCTWKKERERYRVLLQESGLQGEILPVVWHGWHNRIERTPDELVDSFRLMLDELGCPKAGMVIFNQWDHKEEHQVYYRDRNLREPFADWFLEGFLRIKGEGLADAVGWAVEPGPLGQEFLHEVWKKIDFIAPYWNYRDRRNEFLVEFARENGLGVYSVAPFRRGDDSIFHLAGVRPKELARPWLNWVLREPSVFATTVSLPNMQEARMIVEALDEEPISPEDEVYLSRMKVPIQMAP